MTRTASQVKKVIFPHLLFKSHLVIFKLFPLKYQLISSPNISPVKERRRTVAIGLAISFEIPFVSSGVCECIYQLMCLTPPSRCCFSSMNLRTAFFRSSTVAFCTTTMAEGGTFYQKIITWIIVAWDEIKYKRTMWSENGVHATQVQNETTKPRLTHYLSVCL